LESKQDQILSLLANLNNKTQIQKDQPPKSGNVAFRSQDHSELDENEENEEGVFDDNEDFDNDDYEEGQDRYNRDVVERYGPQGHDLEDNEADSVAECAAIEPDPVTPGSNRAAVIKRLRSLACAKEDAAKTDSDFMSSMFKGQGAKTHEKQGLIFSSDQRSSLKTFLGSGRNFPRKAYLEQDQKSLPVCEEDFKFTRTPVVNQVVKDWINTKKKKLKQKGVKVSNGLLRPQFKSAEQSGFKMDTSARVGLKYASYGQWLSTALKSELQEKLGKEHELCKEGSAVDAFLEELYLSQQVQMAQFARVTIQSTLLRRRMYLNEFNLEEQPENMALNLPLDPTGIHLFGTEKGEDDKTVSIDTIITDFAKKVDQFDKASSAFKNSNRGRGGGKRPPRGGFGHYAQQNKRGRYDFDHHSGRGQSSYSYNEPYNGPYNNRGHQDYGQKKVFFRKGRGSRR